MKWLKLVALVLAASCARKATVEADSEPPHDVPTLGLEQVAARLEQPSFHLYDANPKDMYDRGHIRGATWVKFNDVRREQLPASTSDELLFYCANELCEASHQAARLAKSFGFSRVWVMPAGYFGWKKAGYPVEDTAPAH